MRITEQRNFVIFGMCVCKFWASSFNFSFVSGFGVAVNFDFAQLSTFALIAFCHSNVSNYYFFCRPPLKFFVCTVTLDPPGAKNIFSRLHLLRCGNCMSAIIGIAFAKFVYMQHKPHSPSMRNKNKRSFHNILLNTKGNGRFF